LGLARSKTILVAGFGNMSYDNLHDPFICSNRLEDDYCFDDLVKVNSLALSEYEPFFRFFDKHVDGIETFGLAHYRCFLDVSEFDDNCVYVAQYEIQSTMFQQFIDCHSYLREQLIYACEIFNRETNFDSLDCMQQSSLFYYRNLFIAPIDFAKEWYLLSKKIAYALVQNFGLLSDRWIGFILERLFSVFVVSKSDFDVCVVPAVFMEVK
jgi:hypothetical protein